MTDAALLQSILASTPEIVVVTGACILLILGQLVRKEQEYFLCLGFRCGRGNRCIGSRFCWQTRSGPPTLVCLSPTVSQSSSSSCFT